MTAFVTTACLLTSTLIMTGSVSADPSVRTRLIALAGNGAKDCASPATNDVAPGSGSEPCLVQAFREKRAAFWAIEGKTKVSRYTTGMAVTSKGGVVVLESRDGQPVEHQCTEPAIVREFGRERLRCKETYVAPFKAAESPYRSGNFVAPPKPKAPIEIPAAICDPNGPGRNVQVEFVVDANGKVLLVNILAAAKQCQIPELEAALRQLGFEPGTVNGEPVITSWFTIIFLKKNM